MADIQTAFQLQSQGNFVDAEKIYLEFLSQNPKQPDVSNLLGLIYLQTQKFDEAKKYFEYAVEGFPCAEYFQNLGMAHYKIEDYETAMKYFEKAVEFESKNLDFIRNFAKLAKQAKQYQSSIDFYKRSLEIEPKDPVGLNNIGILYERLHDYAAAKTFYQKSLKIKPNYEAYHNLGVLYRNERNFQESLKCLKQALKFKPSDPETLKSIGMTYLSKKDVVNGHKYFHKSKTSIFNPDSRKNYKNYWDGQKHPGKTLFVFYFVGYGDHIMFSRYLPLLKDYFETVKVSVPESLKELFAQNYPDIVITDADEKKYDYSANIMELYHLLKLDFDNIPAHEGYFNADEKLVEKYKIEYFDTEKRKIGLFWQGNPKVLRNRSIKLRELESILSFENSAFYSFEMEDEERQIFDYPQIVDLSSSIKTFSDTAGALMNLDVLVTIDSAIAHLAGALGVKTYLLLPYASEWRWFDDTKTTPWYDSVTVFKQNKPWQWEDAVKDIYLELKNSD